MSNFDRFGVVVLLGSIALSSAAKVSLGDVIMDEDVGANAIATTTKFEENPDTLIPFAATTTFHEPLWSKNQRNDPTSVAHHELLHAIGFASYHNMLDHLQPVNPATGFRNFVRNADRTGATLAKFTVQGKHIDPKGGVINGFDQNTSLMVPDSIPGRQMGLFEKSILDTAFDWSHKNISITPKFVGPFTATEMGSVNNAVNAAHTLFNSNKSGSKFTWTVTVDQVPEPSSFFVFGACSGIAVLSRLLAARKARASISTRGNSSVGLSNMTGRKLDRRVPLLAAFLAWGAISAWGDPGEVSRDDLAGRPVSELLAALDSKTKHARVAATSELFRRGRVVLPELRLSNPQDIENLHPKRSDVVYHLIAGFEPGNYLKDSFGLYVERNADRQEIIKMGRRRGFFLEEREDFGFNHNPNCYVKLQPGKELEAVLRDVLSHERNVITVSLNLFEN